SHYLTIQKGFIRQTSTSNIFHAKTRRKRRRRTGIASGETAFFVLRPPGSRYCLRNFLVTHLTASSSFHLSVIGSFHFPGLHAFHCKLLAWNSVSKQHSTCLPEAPQNLFFCAAVEDGATASSRSWTSKNAASRANCPGLDFCPEGLHIIAQGQRRATLGLRRQQEPVLTLQGLHSRPFDVRAPCDLIRILFLCTPFRVLQLICGPVIPRVACC